MGPTGSGKSTVRQTTRGGDRSHTCCRFIRSASGHDTQGVGHGLKSFTSQVLAIRFWDQECRRYVVLVDTPGFDDTFKSDLDILSMISDWLNSSPRFSPLLQSQEETSLRDFVSPSDNGQPHGRYTTEEPLSIPKAVWK
ncbi:hypothetical protein J3R83DRAFT_2458 [Lanmaoa asiatica]|nr:hypothetical protein J3R83DRAFT_2458 [Lanmaoa asiatica]